MPTRFHDDERTLYDFCDLFLVLCPRCQKCARVFPWKSRTQRLSPDSTRRLSCASCGYTKDWPHDVARSSYRGYFDRDWYFWEPLWLQTPCCSETLIAFNAAHLAYFRAFVEASLREVAHHRNASVASRLPRWMQRAQNREAVLKGIERLETKLAET